MIDGHPFQNTSNRQHKLYPKGTVIYHADTPSFGLFYISKGTVKIYMTDDNGREVILRLARAGDILGQEYLLGEKNHHDSAKTLEETVLHFIEGEEFHAQMLQNPSMGMLMMKKMKEELNTTQNRCLDLIRKNVRERLAGYFYYMSQHHADENEKGVRIRIQLSREEIASLIGTANETAIRFISEFKELGLIYEEDRIFHILDMDRLKQLARL